MQSKRLDRLDYHHPAAVAEILERGTWDDWVPLYAAMKQDPNLQPVLAQVLTHQYLMVGDFWKLMLSELDPRWQSIAVAPMGEFVP